MTDNGHLTVRQLAGIVYGKLDRLGVPEPVVADLDHFAACERCDELGFELGEALQEAIESERHHQGVTVLEPQTQLDLVRRVIIAFEMKEGGLIA